MKFIRNLRVDSFGKLQFCPSVFNFFVPFIEVGNTFLLLTFPATLTTSKLPHLNWISLNYPNILQLFGRFWQICWEVFCKKRQFFKTIISLNLNNGGPRLPLLFTSYSYRHLEGHFLAEMAGKLKRLEWQGKKISLKETSRWSKQIM